MRSTRRAGGSYQAACNADLGDARCRIDLALPQWRATAAVTTTDGSGLIAAAARRTRGRAVLGRADRLRHGRETRADAGRSTPPGGIRRGPAGPVGAGARADRGGRRFTVTAGCDRRHATCRDRFANTVNFRGFPRLPDNDFALRAAREGEPGLDGGSLFR